jgi:thiamine pyrophosphokinase
LRAVIFANGNLNAPVKLSPEVVVIAADGGAHHCMRLGIHPAYVIGDLDSLTGEDIVLLRSDGAQIIQFPARKDYTDLELAIRHALEIGAQEIKIYGALGARWDQTIANLLLAGAYPEASIELSEDDQVIIYVRGGETRRIPCRAGDTVSLIPLGDQAAGVTTHNLEYPLDDETLDFGSTRGISNVALDDQASVSLRSGCLLCIVMHQG